MYIYIEFIIDYNVRGKTNRIQKHVSLHYFAKRYLFYRYYYYLLILIYYLFSKTLLAQIKTKQKLSIFYSTNNNLVYNRYCITTLL